MSPLTYKQRLFISYYLGEAAGSGTRAATLAGYASPGKQAYQLLGKPRIKAAIEGKLASVEMSQLEVLARLSDIASADLTDFVEDDGKFGVKVDLKRVRRRGRGMLIKRLRAKNGELDIELHDVLSALTLLGKYFALWDREKPPEISLVEIAKRMKERHDERGSD